MKKILSFLLSAMLLSLPIAVADQDPTQTVSVTAGDTAEQSLLKEVTEEYASSTLGGVASWVVDRLITTYYVEYGGVRVWEDSSQTDTQVTSFTLFVHDSLNPDPSNFNTIIQGSLFESSETDLTINGITNPNAYDTYENTYDALGGTNTGTVAGFELANSLCDPATVNPHDGGTPITVAQWWQAVNFDNAPELAGEVVCKYESDIGTMTMVIVGYDSNEAFETMESGSTFLPDFLWTAINGPDADYQYTAITSYNGFEVDSYHNGSGNAAPALAVLPAGSFTIWGLF